MRVRHPELVLAAAVLVSLPMIPGIIDGGISPLTVLIRFLIALVVCWVAGSILSRLLTNYTNQVRRAEIRRQIEEENERRRELIELAQREQAQKNGNLRGQGGANGSTPGGAANGPISGGGVGGTNVGVGGVGGGVGGSVGGVGGGAGGGVGTVGTTGGNIAGNPAGNSTGLGENNR